MTRFIMRLDDACEWRDVEKWDRIEVLLDRHGVKPLVGVIPCCEDPSLRAYDYDSRFWERVKAWQTKGWEIALHGCTHVYCTEDGGINPVNKRSEFAGLSIEEQREKIRRAVEGLATHGVSPRVFFAPSHTFDSNTLKALRFESDIRVISDTIALNMYCAEGFTFVPQQSGRVRKLPFPMVTFCYHPNVMENDDFDYLETFLLENATAFGRFPIVKTARELSPLDKFVRWLYFILR